MLILNGSCNNVTVLYNTIVDAVTLHLIPPTVGGIESVNGVVGGIESENARVFHSNTV